MAFFKTLSVITFVGLFCGAVSYDFDDKQHDEIMNSALLMYKITLGLSLGSALLSVVLFLICYKRCCGPRVKSEGRIISQNAAMEAPMEYTPMMTGYAPVNATVYQPAPGQQQQYIPPQPL